MNKTYYIEYTEEGNIDYQVRLKENEFFEDEWLPKDQAYVSSLIDEILTDFNYELHMGAENVDFNYSYEIFSELLVKDASGKDIKLTNEEVKAKQTFAQNSSQKLTINERISIDYDKYNEFMNELVKDYGVKGQCFLVVTMKVDVLSRSDAFEADNNNTYSVSMNVPLATNTISIDTASSVASGESRVLAYVGRVNQNIFLALGISFATLSLLCGGGLAIFAFVTRNEDINYEIKVKRLVSSYRSFIQQITNEFDTEGYQILAVGSFNEMLSIRDTLQSPILMCENEDKTKTEFIIPSNTKILYTYEIKVENYDEIYAKAEEAADEPEIIAEDVNGEELAEALEAPTVELEDIEYVDTEDEETDEGVEVIGVVWPEKAHNNKVYRYDPDGHEVNEGDIVLVPSRDVHRNRDIIRKAAVAHGNHKVSPETLKHPLKKMIGIVKRKAELGLTPKEK